MIVNWANNKRFCGTIFRNIDPGLGFENRSKNSLFGDDHKKYIKSYMVSACFLFVPKLGHTPSESLN